MAAIHFIALIHKEADSGYGVSFPDVPGVIAVADSLDQAIAEGAEALAFAFEDWAGDLPRARSLDALRADAAFLERSTDAVVAAIAPAASVSEAA